MAGRLGGEEFGVILPQTNLDESKIIAKRIRQEIEITPVVYNFSPALHPPKYSRSDFQNTC